MSPQFTSSGQSKPFLIGIDSDGTVFDSMETKHKRVFQPVAIELWGLQPVQEEFYSIAESINLYSVLRGINRFAGLAMAFERLAAQNSEGGELVEGHQDLQEFVESGRPLSFAGLRAYNEAKGSAFLEQVLTWSQRSDALYCEIMKAEGSPSFPHLRASLERASEDADIVVISSSSRGTLFEDWGNAGLLPLVTRVEGQEQGSKCRQLQSALEAGYRADHALMVGDAPGDLEAARECGILFFPINPGAESASWERFASEALDRFLRGHYAGEYEQTLVAEFEGMLQPDIHGLPIEASVT